MKKLVRFLALMAAFGAVFLLGWRVMPKVWPAIKTQVVYRVLPQMKPSPAPVITPAPYVPKSNATISDEISPSDSVVYYFYKEYCPYCAQLEPLMAGIPDQVRLENGELSPVKVIALNKNDAESAAIISKYYADFSVSEEEQYVPAVVVGEQYLMPGSEIISSLMDALMAGEGIKTPRLSSSGQE